MRRRVPKSYGQSMVDNCPFCGKVATAISEQGAPVCGTHVNTWILNVKCNCGDYLDLLKGKYGAYFNCLKCGNVNYKKGLDLWRAAGCAFEDRDNDKRGFKKEFAEKWGAKIKSNFKKPGSKPKVKAKPKEIVISSRDSFWFD